MNQLQRDIRVALSWFQWLPYEKCTREDRKAFDQLKDYMEKDLDY